MNQAPPVTAATRLTADSRRVRFGDVFLSPRHPQQDTFESAARAAGASAIWREGEAAGVGDVRWTRARYLAHHTGADRTSVPVLGVTGTDGKTTTAWFIWHCLGVGAARVGTLGWHDGRAERPGTHTMPPPEQSMPFIAALPPSCPGVVCECSSHGLDQHRLAGIPLAAAVVTGIGRDHLDYHRDVAAYVDAKLRIIDAVVESGLVVLNAEDDHAVLFRERAEQRQCQVVTLGLRQGDVRVMPEGDGWRLRSLYADHPLPVPLPGDFNAWNAAAAVLAVQSAGVSLATACSRLQQVPPVPGRLELIGVAPLAYVDYAHTPLALERVIAALRWHHPGKRLVVVVGCGGDRDRGKRPIMGTMAGQADVAIITADNPRSEDPAAIAAAMVADVTVAADEGQLDKRHRHLVIIDRGEAIQGAIALAGSDGVVLVAGKGHEGDQEIAGERLPWDDRDALRRAIRDAGGTLS